jgi:hypothetical protein
MGIRIELFEESILVTVTQEVSDRTIAALTAGLKKYLVPPTPWIYLDFCQSTLSEEAKTAVAALKKSKLSLSPLSPPSTTPLPAPSSTSQLPQAQLPQEVPQASTQSISDELLASKIILVGKDPALFEYKTIDDALTLHKTREGPFLLEKIKLQKEYENLTRKKTILAESLGAKSDGGQSKLSLFKLNASLQGLVKKLSAEAKRITLQINRLQKRGAADPKNISRMNSKKAAVLLKLEKMGLIRKE